MLRGTIARVVAATPTLPSMRLSAVASSHEESPCTATSRHVVYVRDSDSCIDVRSLDGVSWDEQREQYLVEYKIPPVKQGAIDANPMARAKLDIERRPDGMYITEYTENADTAHAISMFIEMLWEENY